MSRKQEPPPPLRKPKKAFKLHQHSKQIMRP
jgi:hypothetical protein